MRETASITPVTDRLRAAGLKSTAPRRAVLETLDRGGHFEAADVYREVSQELTGTSLQAIYIILTALTEAGLARKIETAGASAKFEARVGDNHHHLLCTNCGRIEDVACVIGAAPCMTPSEDHGYVIHTAEVTFTGLCPPCAVSQRAVKEDVS